MNSSQVIETYNLLLWMIDLRNLPEDYEPPALYNMLVMNLNNLTVHTFTNDALLTIIQEHQTLSLLLEQRFT